MRPISNVNTINAATKPFMSPPAMAQPRSPWHSPIPYLFGGLAAMLGLIAFALLILACSYWRVSSLLDNGNGGGDNERDVENESDSNKQVKVYEEKLVVIMAGELKPTFLATPVFTKASSFGIKNENAESGEKLKQDMGDHHHLHHHHNQPLPIITENSENQQQSHTS